MMKKKLSVLALGAALTLNVVTAGHVWAKAALTDGQVTKVDASAGKITIKHGPMKKFDMEDGMTMVYRVQDPAMLTAVKAGDKVKFEAEHVNGQFIVTTIQKAK
jgi:Cu(I)/Ag(I) efflux system periplasmic protein CusF